MQQILERSGTQVGQRLVGARRLGKITNDGKAFFRVALSQLLDVLPCVEVADRLETILPN